MFNLDLAGIKSEELFGDLEFSEFEMSADLVAEDKLFSFFIN